VQDVCRQQVECGTLPEGIDVEECQVYRRESYAVSQTCLETLYAFEVCVADLSCEDVEFLLRFAAGPCADEYEAVGINGSCSPNAPTTGGGG
jgi:hypothetical protein